MRVVCEQCIEELERPNATLGKTCAVQVWSSFGGLPIFCFRTAEHSIFDWLFSNSSAPKKHKPVGGG
jgi:hypothetical protein